LFGGYGLELAALALGVFGAYDSYPNQTCLVTYGSVTSESVDQTLKTREVKKYHQSNG